MILLRITELLERQVMILSTEIWILGHSLALYKKKKKKKSNEKKFHLMEKKKEENRHKPKHISLEENANLKSQDTKAAFCPRQSN